MGTINNKTAVNDQHLGPQGIMVFKEYDAGVAYAKKVGKPIVLDFTGWACVNCRKMEEQVWSDKEIKRMLSDDVVLISLYVDERKGLPKDQQYETKLAGKTKKRLKLLEINGWFCKQILMVLIHNHIMFS